MAVNDAFASGSDALANGGDLIIDGSGAGTGAVEIQEVFGTGAADVYREIDTAGDGSWAVSVKIDSFNSGFHGQLNAVLCSGSQNIRLRINNTLGGTDDYGAAGMEVSN